MCDALAATKPGSALQRFLKNLIHASFQKYPKTRVLRGDFEQDLSQVSCETH